MTQDEAPLTSNPQLPTSNLQPPTSNLQPPHSSFIPHPSSLRWWGWGTLDQSYDLSQRPNFWPLVRERLGVSGDVISPPVVLDAIALPDSRLSAQEQSDLRCIFGEDAVRVDRLARVDVILGMLVLALTAVARAQ